MKADQLLSAQDTTWWDGQIERSEKRRRVEASLATFVKEAWPLVEGENELQWNWHLDVLCGVLERVSSGEIKRLIINISPGTMKSLLTSVFWPAWEWGQRPWLR